MNQDRDQLGNVPPYLSTNSDSFPYQSTTSPSFPYPFSSFPYLSTTYPSFPSSSFPSTLSPFVEHECIKCMTSFRSKDDKPLCLLCSIKDFIIFDKTHECIKCRMSFRSNDDKHVCCICSIKECVSSTEIGTMPGTVTNIPQSDEVETKHKCIICGDPTSSPDRKECFACLVLDIDIWKFDDKVSCGDKEGIAHDNELLPCEMYCYSKNTSSVQYLNWIREFGSFPEACPACVSNIKGCNLTIKAGIF